MEDPNAVTPEELKAEIQDAEESDGAEPKGKKGKSSVETQIARMLVRAIWTQEWNETHPEAKAKERTAAWKEVRAAENNAHGKTYRRALAALRKAGVEMSLPTDLGAGEDSQAE